MGSNIRINYFSKIVLVCIVFVAFFIFSPRANAQFMTYSARQVMFWGSEVCNSSQTNVHFLVNRNGLTTLYASEGIRQYGDSNVEIGTYQVGTYVSAPIPCIVSGSPPITIWVPNGTYIDATTGLGMRKQFFAGLVNPFVKGINTRI